MFRLNGKKVSAGFWNEQESKDQAHAAAMQQHDAVMKYVLIFLNLNRHCLTKTIIL